MGKDANPRWLGIASAVLLFIFLFLCGGPSSALTPPTKEQVEQYRRDGTLAARIADALAIGNHRASPKLAARAQYKFQQRSLQLQGLNPDQMPQILAPPPDWKGMPTTGTVKVLALLIAFNDYAPTHSREYIESKLFGNGTDGYPYESLRNYYRRSSYDKLEIQGNVLGWYTTFYPRSAVPETMQGREALIKEALDYYNAQGHDFTQYDNDGDGEIDYLMVIWTGPHGDWATFWWAYMTEFSDSSYQVDGKRLKTYSWQWESRDYPIGDVSVRTFIHETGHALGLPDYYDYDDSVGPRGGVGGLDMMDASQGDHNCFSKFLLDWINPPTYGTVGNFSVTLRPSATTEDAALVMPKATPGNQFAEFFMIQNRYRANNDTAFPNDGLLFWHVDARLNLDGKNFQYNNSYTDHKLLRLMEADGLEEIETGDLYADAEDYYGPGSTFGPATVPNSSRYDGSPTGITASGISTVGNSITFDLALADACQDAIPLQNNVPYTGTTVGAPSNYNTYNCVNWDESGPEVIHKITTGSTGDIRAILSDVTSDLDVFILSGCGPSNCATYGNVSAELYGAPPGTY